MSRLLQNYRKAKDGETRCEDCAMYYRPFNQYCRGRCGTSLSNSCAVAKGNTCDAATPRRAKEQPE